MSNTLPPLPARPYRRIATVEACTPSKSQLPAVSELVKHEFH